MAFLVGAIVGVEIGRRQSGSSQTQVSGVQFTSSEVDCHQVSGSSAFTIAALFTITNPTASTQSVQVELFAGSQLLTQNSYTLTPAGSDGDTNTGAIAWDVQACPSDVHVQLATG